jgi:hypothetical protein
MTRVILNIYELQGAGFMLQVTGKKYVLRRARLWSDFTHHPSVNHPEQPVPSLSREAERLRIW